MTDAIQTDLKETIVTVAANLFMENGYAKTSIKDIATAAGCTTAALYYYFEDGKSHILREVIYHRAQDVEQLFSEAEKADNLQDFLARLTNTVMHEIPEILRKMNWLMLEFSTLREEERQFFWNKHCLFHDRLREQIARFIPDVDEADKLAWILFCGFFGYGQIFITMGMQNLNVFSFPEFAQTMSSIVGQGMPKK
jgi:AcrR family transcriptional regulator